MVCMEGDGGRVCMEGGWEGGREGLYGGRVMVCMEGEYVWKEGDGDCLYGGRVRVY